MKAKHALPWLDVGRNACDSPHVVILGAGASRAVTPNGDREGRVLPLMADLIQVVGLEDLLRGVPLADGYQNFEAVYSRLHATDPSSPVLGQMEERIREYFGRLALPNTVTVYDELLLCLRAKDLIATFNWDPLLPYAYARNRQLGELPRIIFLHGNVAVGTCLGDRVKGFVGERCNKCGNPLAPSRLLYPIEQKDYASDPFIAAEWEELSRTLEHAYLLTVFGYAAPESDAEAKKMLGKVWERNRTRELAQVEIVDIKPREMLEAAWQSFFVRNHYGVTKEIQNTLPFMFPRRSCDAFASATLQLDPWATRQLPHFNALDDLRAWVRPLVEEERADRDRKQGFQPFRPEERSP